MDVASECESSLNPHQCIGFISKLVDLIDNRVKCNCNSYLINIMVFDIINN
jgi:hypothetical protein